MDSVNHHSSPANDHHDCSHRNIWAFFLIALSVVMVLSFSGVFSWNVWPYIGALGVAFAGFSMLGRRTRA